MRINKFYILIFGISLISSLISYSCTQHDFTSGTSTDNGQVLINLSFEVSGATTKLRSISSSGEEKIKQINVLVFTKSDDSAEELFSYVARLKENSERSIVVSLRKTSGLETVRLVTVMNLDVNSQNFTNKTKKEVLEMITFDSDGKWNTESDSNFKVLPMWGETELKSISRDTKFDTIDLLRSVVRVDVGLNFTSSANGSEAASGISGYKLKKVYLYRSLNKGYLAPSAENYTNGVVLAPTIPNSATKNERIDYLNIADSTKFVRSIYTVENVSGEADNCTALVVGLEKSGKLYYYKVDFSDSNNKLIPLLRNHRYIMNIKTVSGQGSDDPDTALNTEDSNIDWDIVEWDESIKDIHISGNYYLGVDRHEVTLDPEANSVQKIVFKTNISESDLKLIWQDTSQTDFDVSLDYSNSSIIVTAKNTNSTDTDITQNLHIKYGSIDLLMPVIQKKRNKAYEIICSKITVNGTYTRGKALTSNNTISVTLRGTTDDIIGYKYEVYTENIGGISFSASGEFTSRTINVVLQGTGTPTAGGPFALPFIINSSLVSGCNATVVVNYTKKKILSMSTTLNDFGLAIQEESASRSVLESKRNFGPSKSSKIGVEALEFTYLDNPSSNDFQVALANKPDIVVAAYNLDLSGSTAINIVNYLNQGGVVILFSEGLANSLTKAAYSKSALAVFERLFPKYSLSADRTSLLLGGQIYSFNDIDDEITNGPFGDLRKKYWGDDLSRTLDLIGIPSDQVYAYSNATKGQGVTMLRHRTLNLFWAGDGGFLANYRNGSGNHPTGSTTVAGPFTKNDLNEPIDRIGFGGGTVSNSTLFCNLMAWAIKVSDISGINVTK